MALWQTSKEAEWRLCGQRVKTLEAAGSNSYLVSNTKPLPNVGDQCLVLEMRQQQQPTSTKVPCPVGVGALKSLSEQKKVPRKIVLYFVF